MDEFLAAIKSAKLANLNPVKINAVIVRGWYDDEIVELANFAREMSISMCFIEYMPLDSGQDWSRKLVVSGKEIFARINEVFPLEPKSDLRLSETARTFSFKDKPKAEIGIIAPISEIFCGACSRIRLTADGQIRTCLFSTKEHNLRDLLRSEAKRMEMIEFIQAAVMQKERSHSINDSEFQPSSRFLDDSTHNSEKKRLF